MNKINVSDKDVKKILENLYLLAFAVFLGKAFLDTTVFQIEWPEFFYANSRLFVAVLLLIRIVYSESYRLKEVLFAAAIAFLLIMAWQRNGAEILMETLLLIMGGKGISFRKILKVYLLVTGGLLLLTVGAALAGVIENLVYVQGDRVRYAFGIGYPTDFSAHIFFNVLVWGYLRREKIRYLEIGIIALLAVFVYYFCGARVNTICILMAAGIFLYHKIRVSGGIKKGRLYRMNSLWAQILALSPVLSALVMTILSLSYSPDNKFCVLLDQIINNRLRMGRKGIDLFGFSWFGQEIPMQGSGGVTGEIVRYFYLDCSYISIALRYGTIVLGVVLLVWCVIGFRAKKQKDWLFLWVIALVAVQCMIEHHMLDLSYNPFLWGLFAVGAVNADPLDFKEQEEKLWDVCGKRLENIRS